MNSINKNKFTMLGSGSEKIKYFIFNLKDIQSMRW